ncbi:MAG: DinB family protein [Mucilaginibacter sp.]|nr:DinB family protein [Mucilaginibacter sp.]
MSIIKKLLKEIELEAQITRNMLSIVPNDKYDWQPHPKSMSIQKLTNHIAELPGWLTMAVTTDGLDFAANPYEPTFHNNTADVLEVFENQLADGLANVEAMNEDELDKSWTLRNGDYILSAMTKYETLRMTIAQGIHHRAQLGVYLRLLNIAIPGSYGPSADELEKMAQFA